MTRSWPRIEKRTARQKDRLDNSPSWNTDLVWDLQERALNMSKNTKQVKVMVVSRAVIWPSSIMSQNTHSVPQMMIDADSSTFRIRLRFKICRDARMRLT